jgi:hypothetical protein
MAHQRKSLDRNFTRQNLELYETSGIEPSFKTIGSFLIAALIISREL